MELLEFIVDELDQDSLLHFLSACQFLRNTFIPRWMLLRINSNCGAVILGIVDSQPILGSYVRTFSHGPEPWLHADTNVSQQFIENRRRFIRPRANISAMALGAIANFTKLTSFSWGPNGDWDQAMFSDVVHVVACVPTLSSFQASLGFVDTEVEVRRIFRAVSQLLRLATSQYN